jgi:putative ABC transport system permease protein
VGDIAIDGLVLAFCTLPALGSVLAFGLAPALRARDAVTAVRSMTRTGGAPARRLSRTIMAGQLALTTVLIGGSLIVRSFIAIDRVNTGFANDATLTMSVFLTPSATQGQQHIAPSGIVRPSGSVRCPASPTRPGSCSVRSKDEAVTPGWFSTAGIPLLTGRTFDSGDNEDSPGVVIISRAIAERFFTGEDPIERRMKWGAPGSQSPWLTIVGVASAARYRDLRETSLDVYVPYRQTT